MKKLSKLALTSLFFLLTSVSLFAQIFDPVEWSWEAKDLGEGKFELVFTPTIEDHWHIYSIVPVDGPLPTEFTFEENSKITWVNDLRESEPVVEFDNSFGVELAYHEQGATFRRTVKVNSDTKLKGELSFMVCNDERCLPPEWVEFEFDLKAPVKAVTPAVSQQTNQEEDTPEEVVEVAEGDTAQVIDEIEEAVEEAPEEAMESDVQDEDGADMTIWVVFATGFGGGLLALLMPCIFPMIPLTVSFFTKQSKTKAEGIRKAIIYGVSIILIYVTLGMSITLIFGSDALNALATNPTMNFIFFGLFVVFAISFFGAFEITLPSSWVNKAENASNKGGLIGIFFMAFTLALVSFSCTGPIIGTLLVDAASKGELLGPVMGMAGFATALAVPFMLFAAFPGWMNSLPRSGGWLNTVKVSLGFLELAFAFKFFSTADLVLQLHWLERELFFAIWVGIAFLLAMYLFGLFKMPLDGPVDRISVPRMLFGTVFTVFAFYMLPGIWGAPVKIVAGFPPPQHYSESPGGSFIGGGSHLDSKGDYNFGEHCPPGIDCFNDIESAKEYAEDMDKPLMLDFTGWGCVNCRKMEEQVWVDEGVMQRLNDNVVVVSLYVDERSDLPEDEQYVSDYSGKTIKRVGEKWSDFQASTFGNNSQPYYVILDPNSYEPLNGSAEYDPDIQKFKDWLDEGVELYKAQ